MKKRTTTEFETLAASWKLNEARLLAPRKDLNLRMSVLCETENGETILDYGTGMGEPGITVAKTFPKKKVHGIDISEKMLQLAVNRAKDENVFNFFPQKIIPGKFPFEDNYFSAGISSFALEYSTELANDLSELNRVLSKGMHFIVSSWTYSLSKNPFQCLIAFAIRQIGVTQTLAHDTFFKFKDLKEFILQMQNFNFQFVSAENSSGYFEYDSFEDFWNTKYLLSPAVSVDLNLLSEIELVKVKANIFSELKAFEQESGQLRVPFEARIAIFQKG